MRVWGQGGCVAVQQQQQHQKQQQRKIENYMQSDMCCVCDLNHAQVVVSSTFPSRHYHPNKIATIVIESPPPLSSAFDAIVCSTYDC
jgi:hypothetical protein